MKMRRRNHPAVFIALECRSRRCENAVAEIASVGFWTG
jgi:hypothetical protein